MCTVMSLGELGLIAGGIALATLPGVVAGVLAAGWPTRARIAWAGGLAAIPALGLVTMRGGVTLLGLIGIVALVGVALWLVALARPWRWARYGAVAVSALPLLYIGYVAADFLISPPSC